MKAIYIAVVTTLNFCTVIAYAQTHGDYRSNPTTGNDWNTPANWETYDGGNSIWIVATTRPTYSNANAITIRNGHTINIATSNVTADQLVVETGATLTVADGMGLTLNDGSGTDLTANGTLTIGAAVFGASTASASAAINNTLNLNGTSVSINISASAASTINISAGICYISTCNISSLGTINLSTNINFNGTGILQSNGNMYVTGSRSFFNASGSGNSFTSSGNLYFNTVSDALSSAIDCTTAGTINITGGFFTTIRNLTNTATIQLAGGGQLTTSNNFLYQTHFLTGTNFAGTGTLNFNGSVKIRTDVTMPATYTTNVNNQCQLSLNTIGIGSIANNGIINVAGGGIFYLPISNNVGAVFNFKDFDNTLGANLTNNGTINWSGGKIGFLNGYGKIINNNIFNISGDNDMTNTQVTETLTNSATGIITKTNAGVTLTNFNVPFTNAGIIKGVGKINPGTAFTNTGTITPGNPTGGLILQPSYNNSGNILEIVLSNSGYAYLTVTGPITLGGNLKITDNGVADGDYTILFGTSVTGTFATYTPSANFTIIYNATNVVFRKLTIVPITLSSFTVTPVNKQVLVKWATAQEVNSHHFAVERSIDGKNFEQVAVVAAMQFSSSPVYYSYTDADASVNGITYYRLKMYDKDLSYKTSETKLVRLTLTGKSIWPNPASTHIFVYASNAATTFTLTDLFGHAVLYKKLAEGENHISIPANANGYYIAKTIDHNQHKTAEKIFVQH